MSEKLDLLKEIGAQKIHEETHIALKHAQSIIHESFEGFTKVQFLGFISILEREYEQDLSDLKAKGLAYFNDNTEPKSVFIETKPTKKPTFVYILIALFVFVIVAYFSIGNSNPSQIPEQLDNSTIQSVQKNLDPIVFDENSSDLNISQTDENLSEALVEEETVAKVLLPLKVIAKSKLWIGYLNKTDNIKKQTIIKESLELDPNREWLLSLGHGHVDIVVNGETQKFRSGNNIRFLYKNGELKELNFRDFKILNEGRAW